MKSKIRFPPAEGIARVFQAQFLARRRILLPRSPKRCGSVSAGGAAWLVVHTPRQEDRRRLCPWGEGLYRARPPGPSASVPNRQERQRSQMSARRDTFPVLKEYSFPPIHRESFIRKWNQGRLAHRKENLHSLRKATVWSASQRSSGWIVSLATFCLIQKVFTVLQSEPQP